MFSNVCLDMVFVRNSIVFVFVCFYSKITYKNRFISNHFFFQIILGEYSNVIQPYPWRRWLWQLNQHYLRLISHTLQLFWLIGFRGIKQNIIYIYPYEHSNPSRAPSNIHRTFHNSESIVPDNASTQVSFLRFNLFLKAFL